MKKYFKCEECGNLIIAYKEVTSTRRKCGKCGSYHIMSIKSKDLANKNGHVKKTENSRNKRESHRKTKISRRRDLSKKRILISRKFKAERVLDKGRLKRKMKSSTIARASAKKIETPEKVPTVSIIVVNYNGKHFLKRCFDSLMHLNYPKDRYEVIMVDNCSEDGSVSFVKNNYPKFKIIENDVNNYAKANNLGITNSTSKYVALLNNDVQVERNWLIELVQVISRDEKIGGVCSKVLLKNGRIDSAGIVEFPNFYWQQRGYNEVERGQYDKIEEVYALCGVSMLFRRECLNDIGLEDEDFNIYVEEIDLSLRCKKKGWKLIYVPKSVLWHEHSGTIKINSDFFVFHTERNRLFFVAKHYPDELSNAISTSHLFYKDIKRTHPFLFRILPDVFRKLAKEQGREVLMKILPEIYVKIREIVEFEKYDFLREALEKEAAEGILKNEIEKIRAEKEKAERECENLRKETEKYKEEIMKNQLELKKLDYQMEYLNLELNNAKLELSCAKEEIYSKKAEIVILNTKIIESNKKITETEEKCERLGKELQQTQQQLNEKNTQLQQTQQQLNEKNTQLQQTQQQLNVLNIKIEKLCVENEHLKSELMKKKREIYRFYHSRGYKYILGPLDSSYRKLRTLGVPKKKYE